MRQPIIMKPICMVFLFLGAALATKDYTGYQVLRVTPHTRGQYMRFLTLLHDLEDKVDLWKDPSGVDHPIDIMVSPDMLDAVKDTLASLRLETSIFVEDVQRGIDEERCVDCPKSTAAFDYTIYHTYDQISKWVTDFASEHSLATEINIGKSFEGRDIKAVKISSGGDKRVIYLQFGIHAREWISPATGMYMANQMVTLYDADPAVKAMVNNYDWYIVPSLNVDGYAYTHATDRMWRKNRQTNEDSACVGTDLNRNYPYQWGGIGASPSKCSETYRGSQPLSGIEVKVVHDWLQQFRGNMALFMDFHNYGQLWLYSWGYTFDRNIPQPDKDDQDFLARQATAALQAKFETEYFVGMSGPDMYPASGASEDYGYGTLEVKYSYIVELRDEGRYGFNIPERMIEESGIETFEALKVLGNDPLN